MLTKNFHIGFDENLLIVANKFTHQFVDLFYYNRNDKILFAIKIVVSISNHGKCDIKFKKSQQFKDLKTKCPTVKEIVFVWLSETMDFNLIEFFKIEINKEEEKNSDEGKQYDDSSLFISARDNKSIWNLD